MTPATTTTIRGRATYYVASGALLAIGLGQAVVAAWGVAVREKRALEAASIRPLPPVQELPKSSPRPEGPKLTRTPDGAADPKVTAIEPPARGHTGSVEIPSPDESLNAVLVTPITDQTVLAKLDEGMHLRGEGEMKGALDALRAALEILPDHPQLIYQVAYTYDLMGLPARALPLWKTLHSLGRGAGTFYKLAENRLSDKPQEATPVAYEEKEGKLVLVGVSVKRDEKYKTGERQVVTMGIQRITEEAVSAPDTKLAVHFFDKVNGKLDRSLTDRTPEVTFLSLPVDWQEDGLEGAEVEYLRSDLTPDELRKFGKREFYGYVIELYWNDKLQDMKAEPPELAEFAREMDPKPLLAPEPVGSPTSELFPK